jgi:hypothetical protein
MYTENHPRISAFLSTSIFVPPSPLGRNSRHRKLFLFIFFFLDSLSLEFIFRFLSFFLALFPFLLLRASFVTEALSENTGTVSYQTPFTTPSVPLSSPSAQEQ